MKTRRRRTHYEILGVKQTADRDEIKQAYRRRVLRVHPDRNPDDPRAGAKFKRVTEAYDVLSDPDRRRAYDRTLPDNENIRDRPTDRPHRPDPPPEDIPRPGARTNEQWRKLYEEKARQARRAEQEASNRASAAWKKGFSAGVRHAERTAAAKKKEVKRRKAQLLFLYPLLTALVATTVAGGTIVLHPNGPPFVGWPMFIISLIASVIAFRYIAKFSRK